LEEVQRDTAQLLAHGLNPPPAADACVETATAPEAASAPAPAESLGANP
jgi:hypothetical protein